MLKLNLKYKTKDFYEPQPTTILSPSPMAENGVHLENVVHFSYLRSFLPHTADIDGKAPHISNVNVTTWVKIVYKSQHPYDN